MGLVGGEAIVKIYKKYHYGTIKYFDLIRDAELNPVKYPKLDLLNKENYESETMQGLIEVINLMLETDP